MTNILNQDDTQILKGNFQEISKARATNKDNSALINTAQVGIYTKLASKFLDHKGNVIEPDVMTKLRTELANNCGYSPSFVKKKAEKTQHVIKWFKTTKQLPPKGHNDIEGWIEDAFAKADITSEAKLVATCDPNREDTSKVGLLVDKILGRHTKDGSGWKGGLSPDEYKEFDKIFQARLTAKNKINKKGAKIDKAEKEEKQILDECEQAEDKILDSINQDQQDDLNNDLYAS